MTFLRMTEELTLLVLQRNEKVIGGQTGETIHRTKTTSIYGFAILRGEIKRK